MLRGWWVIIEFKNVTKIYNNRDTQKEIYAVKDVSFLVSKGEICGIIGYSGAGKSTLLRMVNGLEIPTKGEIRVAGQEITRLRGKALQKTRQKIGMIFQHFHLLWSRTVRENIAFPLEVMKLPRKEIHRRVDELIERVGLAEHGDAYPSQLSGGQKQRVGIARAIATHPDVLLCDEATSALDPETTQSILALLQEINQELGITILLITHEMSVVRSICENMVVMDQGEIVEQGSVKEIFLNPRHPLTRSFVSSVPKSTIDQKRFAISIEHFNWEQFQQFLKERNVSLQLESTLLHSAGANRVTFFLQGDPNHIKEAEHEIESGEWPVEVVNNHE